MLLSQGVVHGDSALWLPSLPADSVDLILTSPPYADARAYSRIHPDDYVDWFIPFAQTMLPLLTETGSLVLNLKERVASSGRYKGQRHPYVLRLVLALQEMGWRWVEEYVWAKTNAMPGRFGPRTKDAWEHVYHFTRGPRPYFDLDAVRVPYRTPPEEIARRAKDRNGRRVTQAGFGRDRTSTWSRGGADPGNVLFLPQTYNQHKGVAHPALMPEALAEFFVKGMCPEGGVVLDPFAGGGTTVLVARRLGRQAGGIELHREYAEEALRRIK